jgi:hypothetical protein
MKNKAVPRFGLFTEHLARQSGNQQKKKIHHRDAEYAEFGNFLIKKFLTLRPPRLGGELSSGSIQLFHSLFCAPRNHGAHAAIRPCLVEA